MIKFILKKRCFAFDLCFSSEINFLVDKDSFQNQFMELAEIYDGGKAHRIFSALRATNIRGIIFI